MPLFSRASSSSNVPWGWDGNSMSRHDDPPFAQLDRIAQSEVNKINDFYSYKSMQSQSEKMDLATLGRLQGRPIAPPARKIITTDPSLHGAMNPFVGQSWPSLKYDFGIDSTGSSGVMPEFKINFEQERPTAFVGLNNHFETFDKFGMDPLVFIDALLDMKSVEEQIEDPVRNPHPKDKWGRKIKYDYWGTKLRLRNETRYAFQYNFNKIADESGAYIHIRFEKQSYWAKDRSAFDQNLVFTFPESNEEREIWRHVFWDEEYPEEGFPVQTNYSREIARIENSQSIHARNVDQVTTAMGNAQI